VNLSTQKSLHVSLQEVLRQLAALPMENTVLQDFEDLLSNEEEAGHHLRKEQISLKIEEEKIQRLRQQVDVGALDQFLELQNQSQQLSSKVEHQSMALGRLSVMIHFEHYLATLEQDKESLQLERFSCVNRALVNVNANLREIFQELSVTGDCCLSYSDDRSVLFLEGVSLHVKVKASHLRLY
jgi:chromosome segregation ATPase